MILTETDVPPDVLEFDVAIVAVGYERRCRWITEDRGVQANRSLGLEFGFMQEASYSQNRSFFKSRSFHFIPGLRDETSKRICDEISEAAQRKSLVSVFVDVSAMSREMIANVIFGIELARHLVDVKVTAAYAPSMFKAPRGPAPIRFASPVKPALAGWSARPEKPLGAIFGLGGEFGLALGALQVLEPHKTWIFAPRGIDPRYDEALLRANEHIEDIFDVSRFEYAIDSPSITRGKFEALLNSVVDAFRLVAVPLGPKIFPWLVTSTVVFNRRSDVGVWAFSAKDHGVVMDLDAQGPVVWHSLHLQRQDGQLLTTPPPAPAPASPPRQPS